MYNRLVCIFVLTFIIRVPRIREVPLQCYQESLLLYTCIYMYICTPQEVAKLKGDLEASSSELKQSLSAEKETRSELEARVAELGQ